MKLKQVYTNYKKLISSLAIATLVIVGGFTTLVPSASAAAIGSITYTPSGAVVGTAVAASATVTVFTPTTALVAGDTVVLTFPAGTTLANIIASDFTIQQAANGGTPGSATAPSSIAFDNTAKTITLTLAAGSLSTGTGAGTGVVTVSTFSSSGGNEITHPTAVTTTGSFTVTTPSDTGSISNVAFVHDAATKVLVETLANGTGTTVSPQGLTSGLTLHVFSVTRDQYNNFVANAAADVSGGWSFTSKTVGVADSNLVADGDRKGATMTGVLVGTGVIHAAISGLTSTDSGTVTVVAGAAATIKVETAANGSGTIVPLQNLTSGTTLHVYSITRDAAGNFVANAAADSWALTSKTVGVADGNLVADSDSKGAIMTGALVGTGVIHAVKAGPASVDSGVITVIVAAATPTGLAGQVFHGSASVSLASAGSAQIWYTIDGTTPTCSTGTLYSSAFSVSISTTIKAIGCDAAGNGSSVATAIYSPAAGGSSDNGGWSVSVPATPATPETPATPTTPAVPATPASASGLSASQIQSILDVLASFDADASTIALVKTSLTGTTGGSVTSAAVHVFKANLTSGSLGSEVKALQQYLNAHGYPIMTSGAGSTGKETSLFGGATRAALMKFQKAHNISPATGDFGPKTRAAMNESN